jgi:hypothetical protein
MGGANAPARAGGREASLRLAPTAGSAVREGVHLNKNLRRLYVEERLQVCYRIGRKPAAIRVPVDRTA